MSPCTPREQNTILVLLRKNACPQSSTGMVYFSTHFGLTGCYRRRLVAEVFQTKFMPPIGYHVAKVARHIIRLSLLVVALGRLACPCMQARVRSCLPVLKLWHARRSRSRWRQFSRPALPHLIAPARALTPNSRASITSRTHKKDPHVYVWEAEIQSHFENELGPLIGQRARA